MSTETGKMITIVGVLATLASSAMLADMLSPGCVHYGGFLDYALALLVGIICNSIALRLFKRLNDPDAIYSNRIAFLSLILCLLQIASIEVRVAVLSLWGR